MLTLRRKFGKKITIFAALLILLGAGAAGAVYYLRAGSPATFEDGSLRATYRVWSVSKNGNGIRSVNDAIMVQQEIAYQPSLNLPADIWSEEVGAQIEKNTGLAKEGMEEKDGVVILLYRGSRGGTDVEAESRVMLAGANVYILSFMTSSANKEANIQYKEEFFNSVEVLKEPPVSGFNLVGRIITKITDSKFLAENRYGEVITLVLADDAKIFRHDSPAESKEIMAEARFGAEGELAESVFTVKNLVFLEEKGNEEG